MDTLFPFDEGQEAGGEAALIAMIKKMYENGIEIQQIAQIAAISQGDVKTSVA